MADVKWIKLVTDVFDDEKILLIEALPERDAVIVIWFKLLCLAGKQNNGGVFLLNNKIPYTDEMLSTIFRRPINTVRLALNTFESFGMIEIINNTITIPNWDKHQNLQQLEQAREQTRKRVAKYREKQKLLASGETCNAQSNVTVTPTDKNRIEEEKKRIEKEVVVCTEAGDDCDCTDAENRLTVLKGNVLLSENQIAALLDKMEIEVFDDYIERLSRYIAKRGTINKSHYETLLQWYKEDCGVKV